MAQALLALLTSAHGAPAYALIFGVLVACGLGLPLPEDVSLVMGGYLAASGAVHFAAMLLVAFSGILVGDFLIFSAGRKFGDGLASSRWLARLITEDKRCKVEGYFARHGEGLVLAARFFPGLRAVTYFVAGASPMAVWRFVVFDALAACISVPIWMVLGRKLGRQLPQLMVWVERTHWVLLGAGGVVVIAVLFALRRRGRRPPDPLATFTPPEPANTADTLP